MAAWRRIAHERFPDLKNEIDRSDAASTLYSGQSRAPMVRFVAQCRSSALINDD